MIKKIIPEKEKAEDILQETFMKIWEKIHQYDAGKGSLFTWMLNIARNRSIDECRSKKIQPANIQITGNYVNNIVDTSRLTQQLDYIGVSEVVKNLRPQQQELIELIYFCGHTQAEAADILNVPLGTVKTRVRAAMQYLRVVFK